MNKQAICDAFCDGVTITPVPMGFAVKTPFLRPDGDHIGMYIRPHERDPSLYRIEDDGGTLASLEIAGFDMDKESRQEAFLGMLADHGAHYNDQDVVIHTDYVNGKRLGAVAVSFAGLMLRIFDLLLLVSDRVRRSFKEDLAVIIEQQFPEPYTIAYDEPFRSDMKDYVADFIVRSKDGRALAIFAGNAEVKALEALLFWRTSRDFKLHELRSMIVLDRLKSSAIKDRTMSRVVNSGLILATMENDAVEVASKMRDTLEHLH